MSDRTVAWSPVNGHGFELAGFSYLDQQQLIVIEGNILGVDKDLPYAAYYRIYCYPNWELKEVVAWQQGIDNKIADPITYMRTKDGHWTSDNGREKHDEFEGFTDVDISLTPMTNTLPIRRLNLQVGESRDINVIYFEAPLLEPRPARQRYTCLEKRDDGGGLYRLDWEEINFTVDIPVDADGLVLDYPELFKRVWSK